MVSDLQVAVDAAGVAHRGKALATEALILLARHLRYEHGWGRRRVARHFGWTDGYVRDQVEVDDV